MIDFSPLIIVRPEGKRYGWQVPMPRQSCSLVGRYTYARPESARRAARKALARVFGSIGDML